ncbi:MAG: DNA-directed RNA polymerase subunit omega [Candidatus Neomarinimicrobiota bacterium]|nr:DNA-directed RNA polymerase subunit omega [Candidatus Neomarinimicrobiota bacterium]MEC9455592.1 DNA-directed RNA polymerase subunit omega [Candidatus Neomarinimicrobiota bacterium]MEE3242001.1 DNA-directed RNA polymerase subunit omega [Candidatus Neomarinimicrobiota bacterium]MEE3301750.1 DNA-directed RNA polymerase subunit omega [Candidatus Neomarinimicrobiota bacterium]
MAIGPISFKKLLKKTDDIYESVVVSSRRAKQILQERVLKQIIEENTELQEEEGILSEPVVREEIDFDKEEKVTTIALDEYLEGKVDWKKTEESIDQES